MRRVWTFAAGLLLLGACSDGAAREPAAPPELEPGQDLVFEIHADTVTFRMAADDRVLRVFPPEEASFIRGALPALARTRRLQGIEESRPWRYGFDADRRAILLDPETGVFVDLEAFGSATVDDFDGLVPAPNPGGSS